jgi:hypothetical protein
LLLEDLRLLGRKHHHGTNEAEMANKAIIHAYGSKKKNGQITNDYISLPFFYIL